MVIQIWSNDMDELLDDINLSSKDAIDISLYGYKIKNKSTEKFITKLLTMIDSNREFDH